MLNKTQTVWSSSHSLNWFVHRCLKFSTAGNPCSNDNNFRIRKMFKNLQKQNQRERGRERKKWWKFQLVGMMTEKDPATATRSDEGKRRTKKKNQTRDEALKLLTVQLNFKSVKIIFLLHPHVPQMGLQAMPPELGPFQSSFQTLMSSIAAFAMNPWVLLSSRLIFLHAPLFLFSDLGFCSVNFTFFFVFPFGDCTWVFFFFRTSVWETDSGWTKVVWKDRCRGWDI